MLDIHRKGAKAAKKNIFVCREMWTDKKSSSGESVSPDSPEIVSFSAISVSRTSPALGGTSGR